jgi:flagella basal body P-ring formation protein FlgA
MMAAALFAISACLPASAGSDWILARDLAAALPEMAGLPPETPLAPAPAPGAIRVFRVSELRSLAVRWRLESAPEREVCVARPVARLDPARLLEAMRKEVSDARIEILEFSRQPAPEGTIEFPRQGLRHGTSGTFWAGWVRYAGSRRFNIWARVDITAQVNRVLAIGELRPGQPITAAQVMLAIRREFPGGGPYARSLDEVVGKCPRLGIAAGAAIRVDRLEAVKDVARGDTVRVEVRNGGAVLAFEGQAEAPGAIGEKIPVRNPASQKRFLARVEGKGKVAVDAAAAQVKP